MEDDPKKPLKAYAATAACFLFTFLAFWVADSDPFTLKEAGQGVLLAAGSAGLTGGATYQIRNPRK